MFESNVLAVWLENIMKSDCYDSVRSQISGGTSNAYCHFCYKMTDYNEKILRRAEYKCAVDQIICLLTVFLNSSG